MRTSLHRWSTLTVAALLLSAAEAHARAGGGSSGFGGGGGGGGGGGFGSGHGGGLSWPGVLALILLALVFFAGSALASWRYQRRRRARVARTIAASAEAAEDDAWFAADRVQKDAATLFCDVQSAWDAGDRKRLGECVGPDLMVEWNRRLDDFDSKGWHNHVEVRQGPEVEYVGLVNREDDARDRVCVRMSGSLYDVVEGKDGARVLRKDESSEVSAFAEFWTLARRDDHWTVVSIEQEAEGRHNIADALVPTPWMDDGELHDEAVVEQATADSPSENAASLFSVEFSDDARAAALDLSLVDARYAPDVLEVAARRALAAWAEAVDGDDAPLAAVADPSAIDALLYGDDASRKSRLVVRGPRLEEVRILSLDSSAVPPAFTVEARVRGRRYVEDRDTAAVLSGSPDHETSFSERWRLELSGDATMPWRVAQATQA